MAGGIPSTGGYHLTAAERLAQRQWHGSGRVAYLGIDAPLYRRLQRPTRCSSTTMRPHDENGTGVTPPTPTPPDRGPRAWDRIHDVPLKQLPNPQKNTYPPLCFTVTQPKVGKIPGKS